MSLYAETLNHSISSSQPLNKQELETIFGVGASQHIAAHQLNYLTKDQTQATKGKAWPLLAILGGAAIGGALGAGGGYVVGNGSFRDVTIGGIAGSVGGATGGLATAAAGAIGFGTTAAGYVGFTSGGMSTIATQWGLQKAWPVNHTPSYGVSPWRR